MESIPIKKNPTCQFNETVENSYVNYFFSFQIAQYMVTPCQINKGLMEGLFIVNLQTMLYKIHSDWQSAGYVSTNCIFLSSSAGNFGGSPCLVQELCILK